MPKLLECRVKSWTKRLTFQTRSYSVHLFSQEFLSHRTRNETLAYWRQVKITTSNLAGQGSTDNLGHNHCRYLLHVVQLCINVCFLIKQTTTTLHKPSKVYLVFTFVAKYFNLELQFALLYAFILKCLALVTFLGATSRFISCAPL